MGNRSALFGFITFLSISGAVASAATPVLDYTNATAYMKALQQSNDPEAKTILKQIEDGPADLQREQALTQQAGIPLVAPKMEISADTNAAPLYDQWKALRKQRDVALPNYAQTLSYRYQYTPEQIARVQKIFDENHDIFDLLHQAAGKPALVLSDDSFTAYATMRETSREIKTEAYLQARNGKYEYAIATEALGFQAAKQVTSHPAYINYLVGMAMETITLSGMKDILYFAGPNEDIDNHIGAAIHSARPVMSLKESLTGEVAEELKSLNILRTASPDAVAANVSLDQNTGGKPPKSPPFTPAEREFIIKILDASQARFLAGARAIIASADLPATQRRARFAQLAGAYKAKTEEQNSHPNPVDAMSVAILAVLAESDKSDDRRSADEEVTMAAAAILASKAHTGQFPAALPDGFTDPFTGKPLGYRTEGDNGFVVYSAGPDGNFDGGKAGATPPKQAVLFRYPAAAPIPVPKNML